MRIRQPLVAFAAAPVIVLGAGAGLAVAQDDGAPDTSAPTSAASAGDGARADFVCQNLDRIRQLRADRAALLEGRLALLQDARAAAEAAGDAKALERVDARIARVTERQTRFAERGERLDTWAAEHC
jgi:hypothetical protein